MTRWLIAAVAIALFGGSALAGDFYQPDLDRLRMTLARVKQPRAYFYADDDREGCPAMTAACRRAAYIVGGDVVLVGEQRGPLVRANFSAGGMRATEGWLQKSALTALPTPIPSAGAWLGNWVRDDEAFIKFSRGKRAGQLSFAGEALYGTHDPDRVKRGGVNIGEMGGEAIPVRGHLLIADSDPEACKVSMQLIGPYLAVADNNACGGHNVSFSGVYRRG